MNHLESRFQADVVKYLKSKNLTFFSVQNEAGRSALHTARMKAMGLRNGVSDLVVLFKGQVLFLELKTEIGKQSQSQRVFESEVKNLGFDYLVCRNMEEIEKCILFYIDECK